MTMSRVAASLALPDTGGCLACLAALRPLAPYITMAEVRLDRMVSPDLPRLIAQAPCPLIITCRPRREGGGFEGTESARLDLLDRAMELGCAYVDVEWDSLAALAPRRRPGTKIIVSRHWFDEMPADLLTTYEALRGRADAVKLVGMAAHPRDALRVLDLLHRAESPVIGIAMGEAGRVTRLLAPRFPSCLLTYGTPSASTVTAPGQLTLREMIRVYRLHEVTPTTPVHVHLSSSHPKSGEKPWTPTRRASGAPLRISLPLDEADASEVVDALRGYLPGLMVTADDALLSALGGPRSKRRRAR